MGFSLKRQSFLKSGEFLILCSAICFSTGGLLVKFVPWNPMAIAGCRSLLAIPVLFFFTKNLSFKLNRISALAALATFISLGCYVVATKMTTAANAIVLQYIAPVFVVLYAFLFLRKIPSRLDISVLAVALFGIVLFFMDQLSGGGMAGNILAIISGVAYAGVYFLNSLEGANPAASSILGHLCMAVVGVPFLFAGGNSFTWPAILSMLCLGIFQIGLGYLLFTKGIVRTDATNAILISMVEPVLNPVLVFLFIGEMPGVWALVGGSLVIASITVWNLMKAKHSKELTETP